MNLYLITQNVNTDYDTYDSAVVAAETEGDARHIHPNGVDMREQPQFAFTGSWASPEHVTAKLIGVAAEGTTQGAIVASYNAG